ncbi:copper amine oxidase N-terminal domain-containing protein [Paenibacillus rhizoplanae]
MLSSAFLILPLTTGSSYAAEAQTSTTINNGQINNGRVLIPLRAVSENLGASLEWFQTDKVVKNQKNGNSTIWLAANFKRVIVESAPSSEATDTPSRKYVDLDTATQVIKETTYVPLRFVSQSLGATVVWNQLSKQATVTVGNKGLVVNMEPPICSNSGKRTKISEARLKLLSDKLNQVSNVSSIKKM